MAVGPITSWEIDGEAMEIVTDFIFLGSRITADGDSGPDSRAGSWAPESSKGPSLSPHPVTCAESACAGRDWAQEENGKIEDEMAGWHHRLDGLEFK